MLYTETLLNFFFPKFCVSCNIEKTYLCVDCERHITLSKNDLPDWIYSKYSYKDENMRKLLFKLKYYHVREIANDLTTYSSKYLKDKLIPNTKYILVPIPVTPKRERDRGYNQSLLIADHLAKENNDFVVFNILKRVKETKQLNKIKTKEERHLELEDAFVINQEQYDKLLMLKENSATKIIIIDDIATTGASLYSARKTLIESGFKKENILAFTIAH